MVSGANATPAFQCILCCVCLPAHHLYGGGGGAGGAGSGGGTYGAGTGGGGQSVYLSIHLSLSFYHGSIVGVVYLSIYVFIYLQI